jgi:AcrR family transcriptional regulator
MNEPFGQNRLMQPAGGKEMSPGTLPDTEAAEAEPESVKRKQILEGARRVFFAAGFDAASMGEIAREAKVSKGTLYVYFDSKEALFAALIEQTKRDTAERMGELDPDDPDIAGVLVAHGTQLIEKLASPEHVAMVRMVIGAAEKFPALAKIFYEAGPAFGRRRLSAYIEAQQARGRLRPADSELAAWQLAGMCCHPVTVHVVLADEPAPPPDRIRAYAESAVATFMAAYGA